MGLDSKRGIWVEDSITWVDRVIKIMQMGETTERVIKVRKHQHLRGRWRKRCSKGEEGMH